MAKSPRKSKGVQADKPTHVSASSADDAPPTRPTALAARPRSNAEQPAATTNEFERTGVGYRVAMWLWVAGFAAMVLFEAVSAFFH